jgi:hypothetical protein
MTCEEKCLFVISLYLVASVTAVMSLAFQIPADAANALPTSRTLYAVDQSSATRGSISVYDIARGHNLLKVTSTVSNVDDVRGVAVSASTGRLYVAYRTRSSTYVPNATPH